MPGLAWCWRVVLGLAVAWAGVQAGGASAEPQALQAEADLLEGLRDLGITVQLGGVCGAPGQLATYNMGANLLCLGDALMARPQERNKVLHHELVHVVQDCLDGLESPTSVSLKQGLRRVGTLSERQLNGFFCSTCAIRAISITWSPPRLPCLRTAVSARSRPMPCKPILLWFSTCCSSAPDHIEGVASAASCGPLI